MRQRKLDRLRQLGNFLLNLPRKQFNLDEWQQENFKLGKCGSTACGIGYDIALHPRSALKMCRQKNTWNNELTIFPKYKNETYFKAVADFYEMTEDEADYLFYSEKYPADHRGPKSVGRRILKFVTKKEKARA